MLLPKNAQENHLETEKKTFYKDSLLLFDFPKKERTFDSARKKEGENLNTRGVSKRGGRTDGRIVDMSEVSRRGLHGFL